MRRPGIVIMGKLIGLIRPLVFFMVIAVMMGTAGYLCASFLTIAGAAGALMALGQPLPAIFPHTFRGIFLLLVCLGVLRGVLHYFEQECNHYIAFKLLAIIRHQVFAALRRLCPAKLEGKDRGNLISLITSDIELLEVFYAHTVSPIAIAFLTSLIMVCWIGSFHPLCGVLALAGYSTVGILLPLWNGKRGAAAGMAYRQQFGRMNSFILDSLRGLQEILQYGRQKERLEELKRESGTLAKENAQLKRHEGDSAAACGACISLFSFAMLFLSLWLNTRGSLNFSGIVLVTVSMMSSFGPVTALSNLSNNLNQTLACGERVLSILEETPQIEEIQGMEPVIFSGAGCQDVEFSYGEEKILNQVGLDIPKGCILGIHGRSGSGKSTLLKLFMRFWDVQAGSVQISRRDVRNINTSNLRQMESFVTQETVIFHDSIEANIAVGKPGATRKEVIRAAKKASIHDFIQTLPKGYDTLVEELGDSLSGGEKQRIGIARAFLHDGPFLLLDEPTSNLDSLNEGIILKALKEEKEERTVLLVSHRQSTMNIADQVYEMDEIRVS
ncbi:ABC transporter ATP-binding protein [Lachnoclostridium sp. An14]|uniref:amino acid ABC transporter ATP-binding/permease protein n=1 Tax=Lachnoclostridium sp. An14 TaxID=1965562 RepID=UPI000B37BAA9|nr:ABC transporter ATP-binding protein [Lachnoclostridium sp. An14]OUQ20519.1 ABC transporter ATP-binding protein [Lachnoclostridium sp. An14]